MGELKIIKGDILKSNENYILHQVNARGVMGAGIAKEIRKDISDKDFYLYRNYVLNNNDALGNYLLINSINFSNRKYINIIAQNDIGRNKKCYTNYEALESCFKKIVEKENDNIQIKTLAIPYGISCGLAGGNWNIVLEMIKNILLPIFNINIYKLE